MSDHVKSKEAEYRENQIGTEFISCPGEDSMMAFMQSQECSSTDKLHWQRIFLKQICKIVFN